MRFTTILCLLVLAGCAVPAARNRAYSAGSEQPSARAAIDGNGDLSEPQELIAFNLPLGPFTAKGGLLWNGQTWVPPLLPMSAQAADPCAPVVQAAPQACAESFVEEPYTIRVPVQTFREETRVRRYRVRTYSVREAMPECAPAPQAAPDPCSEWAPATAPPPAPAAAPKPTGCVAPAADPCPSGCCEMPRVVASKSGE